MYQRQNMVVPSMMCFSLQSRRIHVIPGAEEQHTYIYAGCKSCSVGGPSKKGEQAHAPILAGPASDLDEASAC